MKKVFVIIICAFCTISFIEKSIIKEFVTINISTYLSKGETKASAMPALKPNDKILNMERRFEYLLMNRSQIHKKESAQKRNDIWSVYPDSNKLQELYLNEFIEDGKLVNYFEQSLFPIENPGEKKIIEFSENELMDIASKFFYCKKVRPDTTIQAYVCIGINGVKEARWTKDYTLLEAFCFEAIFSEMESDESVIWESFNSEKKKACEINKKHILSLEEYLENVKTDLFVRMKNDETLKKKLLQYYNKNTSNLAFKIVK